MPGPEDREAQRRLQPDARAGSCGIGHPRDDVRREDPGDGKDAGRVGCDGDQRT